MLNVFANYVYILLPLQVTVCLCSRNTCLHFCCYINISENSQIQRRDCEYHREIIIFLANQGERTHRGIIPWVKEHRGKLSRWPHLHRTTLGCDSWYSRQPHKQCVQFRPSRQRCNKIRKRKIRPEWRVVSCRGGVLCVALYICCCWTPFLPRIANFSFF